MDKLVKLRKEYPIFIFESFDYKVENNNLVISFEFNIPPDIKFNPTLEIKNIDLPFFETIEKKILENFVFNLGIVEMISYWKSTCSPIIEINAGPLKEEQLDWWKNLILNGLGEFFYQNGINFKGENFLTIKTKSNRELAKDEKNHKDRYLVMNSGGRDSVVSLELTKEINIESGILMLNPTKAALDVAKISQIPNQIVVERKIDEKLLELNNNGFLNGHTPFSAYLAFLGILCGLIFDYRYIVSSNERSANEENVEFLGQKINHQYSKSFEFEKLFREYIKNYLSSSIQYLSILRSLYEIQISKIFSNYKQYFPLFKSCNRGQKTNSWCCQCPKCLSIYITLYPFIEKEKLLQIFGQDLYTNKHLLKLLQQITGNKGPKPFECVGTYKEIIAGLSLSIKKLEKTKEELPFLLEYAKNNLIRQSANSEVLEDLDNDNFLPKNIAETLKAKIQNDH